MPTARSPLELLSKGGFAADGYVSRLLRLDFAVRCLLIPIAWAFLFLAGAAIDHSFLLPGRSVGLLEHPTIWTFLLLQAALPLILRKSLIQLGESSQLLAALVKGKFDFEREVVQPLIEYCSLRTNAGRVAASIAGFIGFTAFVWNSYQNQLPGTLVPFDFWDSIHFPVGYWLTRAYKFYLFICFLPYVAVLHSGVIWTLLSVIRKHRRRGELRLNPFSGDGVGGLGFIPSILLKPIVVTLLLAAVASATTFVVHQGAATTPIIGVTIILSSLFTAYLGPAAYLRADIAALKRVAIDELTVAESRSYENVLRASAGGSTDISDAAKSLEYFEHVRAKIEAIPEFPYFTRMISFVGFCFSPTAVSLTLGVLKTIPGIATHLLTP